MKHKLIILALVFSLVFVSQNTFSLGMGKIQVNSALDEPLNASIDIIANNDESIDQVSVKLASADDYKKVGLDKSFVPAHIMVSVDEDNPYQINVRSNGPVSEPIVSLLLDVKWPNGRILREFTLLLDPPSYQTSTRGSVTMPVTEPPSSPQTDTLADVQDDAVTAPTDDIPPVSQDLNQAYEEMDETAPAADKEEAEFTVETPMDENISETLSVMPGEVYVESGDTLWRIANQNKPTGITTHQMMMAIYEKNPGAFLNNNINEMIKGSTLQMPDADTADDLSYQEALAAFESHNNRWAAEKDNYSSFQTATEADEETPVADTIDYGVQLSGGEGDDTDSQQTEGDVADSGLAGLSDEEAFNVSSENEELKSRVSELEDIVNEQQSALELQDDDLANLENQMAQVPDEEDSLSESDFDGLSDTATTDDNVDIDDEELADDVWDTAIADSETEESAPDQDETDLELADIDASLTDDETVVADESLTDEVTTVEDDTAEAQPVVTTPVRPQPVGEPWYTSAINWIQHNVLWVIIGLVVLFLIILLPRMFNRDDEEPAEDSSFLDDIKSSRSKQGQPGVDDNDGELEEEDETVLTTPIAVDDDSDDDLLQDEEVADHGSDGDDIEDDEDVLAELDSSLAFDDSEDDADDDFEFDFDDEDDSAEPSDDSVDDLDYETPTKEYDPAPFRDDDIDDDDFDLSDLDDDMVDEDSDVDSDVDLDEDSEEDSVDTLAEDDLFGDDLDLEAELTELDDELEATDLDEDVSEDEDNAQDDDDFSEDDFMADLDDLDGVDFDEAEEADKDTPEALDEEDDEFEASISLDEDDSGATFETDEEEDMDDDIDLGLDDLMDEGDVIETKLDLAKAYIEMGDTEGAKNLLEEVKAEGNAVQQSQADKLLDEI